MWLLSSMKSSLVCLIALEDYQRLKLMVWVLGDLLDVTLVIESFLFSFHC